MQIRSPEDILSIWPSLTPEQQAAYSHLFRAASDPLYFLQNCTKTLDEQDKQNPYKPFPRKPYFPALLTAWQKESRLFLEKSRTMMATWFFAGLLLHEAMTTPATRVLIIAQDELRSLKALSYAWTLYENMDAPLRELWPLDRPREKQAYNVMELQRDSSFLALPGKDAGNKIRSEHPTYIFFDEAAFIEDFHGAMNSAISTRAKKIVAVTSANPGDFREITKDADSVPWYDEVSSAA